MKHSFLSLLAFILLLSTMLSSCTVKMAQIEKEALTETLTETASAEETQAALPTQTEEKQVVQPNPGSDRVLNILVIGNSFSTGWPDELNGLFTAAGIKVNIFTVYYSGCPLSSHWHWLQKDRSNYRLRHHQQEGGISDDNNASLKFCLKQRNWDIISLQQHFGLDNAVDYDKSLKSCTPYAENLFEYLKTNFPKTQLVWHETWAYEVKRDDFEQKQFVDNVEIQTKCYENISAVSIKIANDNQVPMIPCGDAWQIARANPLVGDTMTRDGYHDGPEGGGQYLNACVWYEMITGNDCRENTWRPKSYTLAEERIVELQKAAHEAVQNNPVEYKVTQH